MGKLFVKKIIAFPRADLESHWWHRMAKIIVYTGIPIVLFLSIVQVNTTDVFKPYNAYSFDPRFSEYSNQKVESCSTKNLFDFCGEGPDQVVSKYSIVNNNYVNNFLNAGYDNYSIMAQMKKDGLLNNVKAVDLQWNGYGNNIKLIMIILAPFLWYLITSQVIYRIIAYIFAGKRSKDV